MSTPPRIPSAPVAYDKSIFDQILRVLSSYFNVLSNPGPIVVTTITGSEYTVATLPTAAKGMRVYVTDATATTFASTVAGGGANIVPVFYNGTNWVIG